MRIAKEMKRLLLILSKSLSSPEVQLLIKEYRMSTEKLPTATYIESYEHGLAFICKANLVSAIFVYADNVENSHH